MINNKYEHGKMMIRYIINHLKYRHKNMGLLSSILGIFRLSRVLFFFSEHCRLFQLDIYRNYIAVSSTDDLFHHLSGRYYMANNLSALQRIQCVLSHYQFENTTFNSAYKRMVYLDQGLTLWTNTVNGVNFVIKISMELPKFREGELCISLFVDQQILYTITFTWINSNLFNLHSRIVPFIANSQGRNRECTEPIQKFKDAFPQNLPIFFCFAAMQGVARTVGANQIIGVDYRHQVCYNTNDSKILAQFPNTYDAFWESIGGVKLPSGAYLIPVPFQVKPLSEVAANRRGRAARRRAHWREIEESARIVLQTHMIRSPSQPTDASDVTA
ncbi:MAG: DUF535 family protein [Sulfuricurvum sp.]